MRDIILNWNGLENIPKNRETGLCFKPNKGKSWDDVKKARI